MSDILDNLNDIDIEQLPNASDIESESAPQDISNDNNNNNVPSRQSLIHWQEVERNECSRQRTRQCESPDQLKDWAELLKSVTSEADAMSFMNQLKSRFDLYDVADFISSRHRSLIGKYLGMLRRNDKSTESNEIKRDMRDNLQKRIAKWNQRYVHRVILTFLKVPNGLFNTFTSGSIYSSSYTNIPT
jgi:hypothetical protein